MRLEPAGFLGRLRRRRRARQLATFARSAGIDVRSYGESPDADVRITELELVGTGSTFQLSAGGPPVGSGAVAGAGPAQRLNAAGAATVGLGLGLSVRGVRGRADRSSPAPGADSSPRAWSTACASSTTTPTIPPRLPRSCGPPAASSAPADWWSPSRPTTTTAPRTSAPSSAGRSRWPTTSWSWRSTRPAKRWCPAAPAPHSRRPYHCRRSGSIFEPSWAAVPAQLAARARPGDLVLTMGAGGEVAMLGPRSARSAADGQLTLGPQLTASRLTCNAATSIPQSHRRHADGRIDRGRSRPYCSCHSQVDITITV